MTRPGPRTPACVLMTAIVLSAFPSQASASPCASTAVRPTAASAAEAAEATVCLINRARTRRGLRPLRANGRLALAARRHSRDMVRRRFFSHWSLGGASPLNRIRRAGYLRGARSFSVGENIAWGAGSRATADSIVRRWMRSRPHRTAILHRRFRAIGVGVASGAPLSGTPAAATYTADFGRRR
jgi:uncharacterized protein YkwD